MSRRSNLASYAPVTASGASSPDRRITQSVNQASVHGFRGSDISSSAFASLMNESIRWPGRSGDSSLHQDLLRPPNNSRRLSRASRASGSFFGARSSLGTDSDMSDSEFEALLAESMNYRGPRLDRPSGSLPEARHAQSTNMAIPARRGGGAEALIGGSTAGTSLLAQFFSDPEARARADAAHPRLSMWQREQARRARGERDELQAAPKISAALATSVVKRSTRPRAASTPTQGMDPSLAAQIRPGWNRANSVPARRQDILRERAPLVAHRSIGRQSLPLSSASHSTSLGARRFSASQPGGASYTVASRSTSSHAARHAPPELSPTRLLLASPSRSPARSAEAGVSIGGAIFSRLSAFASLCCGRRKPQTRETRPLLSGQRRGRTAHRRPPSTYTSPSPASRARSGRPSARTPSPTLDSLIARHREEYGTF